MAGSLTLPDGTVLTAQNFLRAVRPALDPAHLAEQRILVTGASGFIGTNLVEFYRGWGAGAVVNFDIAAPRNPEHWQNWVNVDICDAGSLGKAMRDFHPTAV